jgi:hypothetical protein
MPPSGCRHAERPVLRQTGAARVFRRRVIRLAKDDTYAALQEIGDTDVDDVVHDATEQCQRGPGLRYFVRGPSARLPEQRPTTDLEEWERQLAERRDASNGPRRGERGMAAKARIIPSLFRPPMDRLHVRQIQCADDVVQEVDLFPRRFDERDVQRGTGNG